MADGAGQADIRSIDVTKFVTGFRDEPHVLKKYARQSTTKAREIRWFQKTAGYISPTTTSGITSDLAYNTASKAIKPIAGQTWTRQTSYVKTFSMESEIISEQDIKDSDVDVLGTMIKDLVIGVMDDVETRLYNVLTENLSPSTINTAAATGTGWDDGTNGKPVYDIMAGIQKIRSNRYLIDSKNRGILYINSIEYRNLIDYLTTNGNLWPTVSSEVVIQGSVMSIQNCDVVVSENATTDYALIFIPNVSVAWKQFMPLKSEVERLPGKGRKIYVWEEGEALLENPKSVHLITDTVT